MTDDPFLAATRQQLRDAAHRRRRESQREDLIAAARVLLPELGLGVTLGRIAVHAGLPRQLAAALFNTTADLAVALVRRAWRALVEQLVPPDGATPVDLLAALIDAIRADAASHRIYQTLCCGAAAWQREAIAAADALLALAVGEALRAVNPAIAPDQAASLGGRALALARHAALDAAPPDTRAEAAVIAAMLVALTTRATAAPPPLRPCLARTGKLRRQRPASRPPADRPIGATRSHPAPPRHPIPRPHPRGQDPPDRAA